MLEAGYVVRAITFTCLGLLETAYTPEIQRERDNQILDTYLSEMIK